MIRKTVLDFSLLSDVPGGSLFWSLRPSVAGPLSAVLPETASWLYGALYLASLIGWDRDTTVPSTNERVARSAACFRGYLAEFARVDHVVGREFRHKGLSDVPTLVSSRYPAFHLFRELRNLELHLAPSQLSSREAEFTVGSDTDTTRLKMVLLLVQDVTLERLMKLDNSRYYGQESLQKMAEWLQRNQATWGIGQVIHFVTEAFAHHVLIEYRRQIGGRTD